MRNLNDQLINRRSILHRSLAFLVGAVTATAVSAQSNENPGSKRSKAPARMVNHGLSYKDVLSNSRQKIGLQSFSDISGVISNRERIGDTLTQGLSAGELEEQKQIIKTYASNTIFELMETGAYSAQRQVDMKFIYIPAQQEIENTVDAFRDNLIDLNTAKLEIRSTYGRFLDNLEQLPAN